VGGHERRRSSTLSLIHRIHAEPEKLVRGT